MTTRDEKPARERVRINRPLQQENIGYGRPPRAHQFKPGHSGNPKGRPKGAKSEAAVIQAALAKKIALRTRDGHSRKITILEAIVQRMVEQAINGNLKTSQFLLNRKAQADMHVPEADEMSHEDKELLNEYLQNYLQKSQGQR